MLSAHNVRGFAFFAAVSLVSGSLLAGGASIKNARAQAEGTVVTVSGVVSVPSGVLAPNDQGFAIQDGKYGIYIHDSLGGNYTLGQKATVTGVLANNFGQVLGVDPSAIAVNGTHPVHPAKPMDTGDVDEDTEGRLVRIRGTVVDDVFADPPYGALFHVDDGSGEVTVFVYTGTGADLSDIEMGDEVEITGFSGQFIGHYEVNPRFQSDIDVLGCH